MSNDGLNEHDKMVNKDDSLSSGASSNPKESINSRYSIEHIDRSNGELVTRRRFDKAKDILKYAEQVKVHNNISFASVLKENEEVIGTEKEIASLKKQKQNISISSIKNERLLARQRMEEAFESDFNNQHSLNEKIPPNELIERRLQAQIPEGKDIYTLHRTGVGSEKGKEWGSTDYQDFKTLSSDLEKRKDHLDTRYKTEILVNGKIISNASSYQQLNNDSKEVSVQSLKEEYSKQMNQPKVVFGVPEEQWQKMKWEEKEALIAEKNLPRDSVDTKEVAKTRVSNDPDKLKALGLQNREQRAHINGVTSNEQRSLDVRALERHNEPEIKPDLQSKESINLPHFNNTNMNVEAKDAVIDFNKENNERMRTKFNEAKASLLSVQEELNRQKSSANEASVSRSNDVVPERIDHIESFVRTKFKENTTTGKWTWERDDKVVVAFKETEKKLQTRSKSPLVASSMVSIADSRGWSEIQLKGSKTFRKEAWMEASLRGMDVKGYEPTEQEKIDLKEQVGSITMLSKNKENSVKAKESLKERTNTDNLTPQQQKVKDELVSAYKNNDRGSNNSSHPELKNVYSLDRYATDFADKSAMSADQKSKFVQSVNDKAITEIAKGRELNVAQVNYDAKVDYNKTKQQDRGR